MPQKYLIIYMVAALILQAATLLLYLMKLENPFLGYVVLFASVTILPYHITDHLLGERQKII